MEENIENGDSLNTEAEVVLETTEETEGEVETTEPEVDVEKLQETNKKLYARLKVAEAKLKTAPKVIQPIKKELNSNSENYLTREEAILIAKGEDEVSLAKLKAIAKGSNVSLLEAQKDEMFIAWKDKQEVENKKSKGKLGASKGSGSQRPEKSVAEMTPEEHRKFVETAFGK